MDSKWTPGPWRIVDGSQSCHCCFDKSIVADIFQDWDEEKSYPKNLCETLDCTDADAHLIAAAPDLYEALENCFNALMSHIHNEYDGVYTEQDFAEIEAPYRAALAKARGEA